MPEGVEATARDGDLTLTGSVKYDRQRAAAKSAVGGLTGVRGVRDETDLVFDVDPDDVNRLVGEALRRHAVPPDDSSVVAIASGNTVMLTGRVRTQAQREPWSVPYGGATGSWPSSMTRFRSPADRPDDKV